MRVLPFNLVEKVSLVNLLTLTHLNIIAFKRAIDAIALVLTTRSTLSLKHPWHGSLPDHLPLIDDLLLNNSLLRVPVPLIPPKQPLDIIKAPLVKRISIFPIASFKILICSLIPYDEVLMVAKQPEYKNSQNRSEHQQDYRSDLLARVSLLDVKLRFSDMDATGGYCHDDHHSS